MTSYLRYKQELRIVQDADDIESWITVRGNHIPIKKGQSKEEAVKSFVESKGGNSSAKGSSQKNELSIAYHKDKGHIKEGNPPKGWTKVEGATTAPNGYSWYSNNKSMFSEERESYLYKDKPESKYDPEFEVVRKNALANGNVYGGKYTQKSKAEAYKEYKNDISSKENMKKASAFVNSSGSQQSEKTESSKKWSGAWSKRANKPESLGNAANKATEISKKQAEKNFKSTEIPANKLKVGDIVKHDGELFKVYKSDKENLHLESKESTMLIHKNDKTSKYMSVSPQEKEKLEKVLNKLNSKEEENYKKWTEKKPEFNTKKLMKGDLEEFDKFSTWLNSAGAMKYEKKQDFIYKTFGSEKNYWTALHNNEVARKERAKTNKNYLDDDVGMGLLEIAYNDVSFSNKASSNRSALLKAIKESKHESSKEMTELIKNIPDEKIKNIGAFLRYIENATEGKK